MPRIATTHTLSDYPRLPISHYREQTNHGQPLTIRYTHHGKPYHLSIKTTATACHYGGHRYWWLCPNCGRRVAVLYCAGLYVCRHCIGANYATQLMQPTDKLFKKVEKIRHKLGWQAGIAHGHGTRPKGMHQATFDKLVAEHDKVVNQIIGNYQHKLTR